MRTFATILLGLTMLATLGVLFAGLIGMARGGSPQRSNELMRWRVILQAGALGLLALIMLMMRG